MFGLLYSQWTQNEERGSMQTAVSPPSVRSCPLIQVGNRFRERRFSKIKVYSSVLSHTGDRRGTIYFASRHDSHRTRTAAPVNNSQRLLPCGLSIPLARSPVLAPPVLLVTQTPPPVLIRLAGPQKLYPITLPRPCQTTGATSIPRLSCLPPLSPWVFLRFRLAQLPVHSIKSKILFLLLSLMIEF